MAMHGDVYGKVITKVRKKAMEKESLKLERESQVEVMVEW